MVIIFKSTKPGAYDEDRKALVKNHNLSILQYMYMGARDIPLACLVSGTPAFITTTDFGNPNFGNPNKTKKRFRIDFNHIRQRCSEQRSAGVSVDKSKHTPSGLFRGRRLDEPKNIPWLIEFMTIIPVSTEMHSYISQDSTKNDITLKNFKKKTWPWFLKDANNFNKFCKDFKLDVLDYNLFVEHLSDVKYPPIHDRRWI